MDWLRLRAIRRQPNGSRLVEASRPARKSQLSLVSAGQKLGQAARRPRISAHHARSGRLLEALQRTLWTRSVLTKPRPATDHLHLLALPDHRTVERSFVSSLESADVRRFLFPSQVCACETLKSFH